MSEFVVICRQCDSEKIVMRVQELSNGQHRVRASCGECDNEDNLRMSQDTSAFTIPFGKYKGKTIKEVYRTDKQYIKWASENMFNNVGNRIREFMDK